MYHRNKGGALETEVATDYAPSRDLFGQGPLPPQLKPLNLNALLWRGLWAIAYRDWLWLGVFAATRIAQTAFFWWFNVVASQGNNAAIAVPVSILSALAVWVPAIAFSIVANRRLWDRQNAHPTGLSKTSVERYLKNQRDFAWFGLALAVAGIVQTLIALRSPTLFSKPGAIAGIVIEAAVIAVAALVARHQSRAGRQSTRDI